ncbi:serine protease hepsin-like [Platysternon megacephalum]|uniref:Serine protease hepsin-like n=1 Tax=Platysternon megacephalum TaxID=55544 RepID=A0A4D9DJK0_9SAUR|nr:serine protease hepsin-like [Platysternon megacephalum]
MTDFTGGEVYQAEFDPKAFLEYFKFGEDTWRDDFLIFILKQYCKTFTSGVVKGDTLIDIGSGPNIHQLLSACESFKEIIASDYTYRNHWELEKWLKNEPEAFDWTPVVEYVCELEGNSSALVLGICQRKAPMSYIGMILTGGKNALEKQPSIIEMQLHLAWLGRDELEEFPSLNQEV